MKAILPALVPAAIQTASSEVIFNGRYRELSSKQGRKLAGAKGAKTAPGESAQDQDPSLSSPGDVSLSFPAVGSMVSLSFP